MSKYILITAIIAGLCRGCPMGLGKQYANKPAFFHPDFYAYKQTSTNASTPLIVAQKDSITDHPIVDHPIVDHSIVDHPIVDQRRSS